MADVSDALLEELAGPVAAAIPLVIARIPKVPAAELGRLRATADGMWPIRGSSVGHLRARRSQLAGGEHRWIWLALHRATNPDPLAAATEPLEAARYAVGPHAANLIAEAQSRITAPEPP
ncbi:hypothetical protein ABT299_24970 [Spirillospora sp. NPDC000708]